MKTAGDPVARPTATGYRSTTMQALEARVQNGRLVLDEPTDRPEGEVVYLNPADDDGADELDDEEREARFDAIEQGLEDGRAGRVVDADEFLKTLAAKRK